MLWMFVTSVQSIWARTEFLFVVSFEIEITVKAACMFFFIYFCLFRFCEHRRSIHLHSKPYNSATLVNINHL